MKSLFNFFFLITFLSSFSQNEQPIDTIGTDVFGSLYTVKDNTLFKKQEDKSDFYQNLAFGDISTVDIMNASEIVVFYQDYNAVVILDHQLNEMVRIQFYETILFVNKGIVNNLWRFNDSKNRLELYDYKSKTTTSSSQVLTDFIPLKMESNFNSVKLIGADKTLLFNQYLNLTETIFHQKND